MLKVLVAVDGSDCSEKALRNLRKAGMPEKAQAVVLSVADDWAVQQGILDSPDVYSQYAVPFAGFDFMELSLKEAKSISKEAAETLREYFPLWSIQSESATSDSATWGVIAKIESWKPDLVVMGSHGRSQVGRLLFGSVSHKVLTHVHCNLRISRGSDEKEKQTPPLRIVVAYDGSQESETAFEAALSRHWPKGTAIRLITVIDMRVSLAFLRPTGPMRYWTSDEDKNPIAWVDRMLSYQKQRIEEKGLIGYSEALKGDPKRILLKEAEEWGADSIFVGSRGLSGKERIIAGSVSTALATHAHCSVEIVHRLWDATLCCENARAEHRDTMIKESKG